MSGFIVDQARTLAPITVVKYGRSLDMFKRYLGKRLAHFSVAMFTRDDLRDFWAWCRLAENGLHGRQRSEGAANKIVEALQLFWGWCFDNDTSGIVPPLKRLKMVRELPKDPQAPTWAEMDACIASCTSEPQRRTAILLRNLGIRSRQAAMLRWEHVDLEAMTIHITTGKSAQEKRGRVIPITKHLVEEMKGWGPRVGWLIVLNRDVNSPRAREPRARDMERVWIRSGVRESAWKGSPHHAFRDGFMSGLKMLGADDEAVKYLVGHSRGLRERYVGPTALPLTAAVALIPPMSTNLLALRAKES